MSATTYFLLALAAVTVLLSVGVLLERTVSDPHPWVTDPWETEEERIGKHEMPGESTGPLRWPNGTPRVRYPGAGQG